MFVEHANYIDHVIEGEIRFTILTLESSKKDSPKVPIRSNMNDNKITMLQLGSQWSSSTFRQSVQEEGDIISISAYTKRPFFISRFW